MRRSLSIWTLILAVVITDPGHLRAHVHPAHPHPPHPQPRVGYFTLRVVAAHLSDPWSVCYGPDGYLWVTEAKAYKVSRIDPVTGDRQVILDLTAQRRFPRYDSIGDDRTEKPWPEGGLTGMALHPRLLDGKPYVYLAYIYRFNGSADTGSGCLPHYRGCFFTTRLVRYTWDEPKKQLVDPVILCDTIPGSSDNNAGRLLVAPVDGKEFLFFAVGDLGAGQFDNAARPNHAQQKDCYEGKILRFNTEPDRDTGRYDRWIPNDNPFNNAVWTYGNRNPEGLAYAVIDGQGWLYSSEHGPYSDDEINIIEKGKNYGHPLVIGFADGNYDGLSAGVTNYTDVPGRWHTSYPLIVSERANRAALGTDYRDPLISLYPNSHEFLTKLFQHIRSTGKEGHWPSEAPGSLAIYTSDVIPGWKNSLLLPSLKTHKLIRLKLNKHGDRIVGDTIGYFRNTGRLRDIAISPDGAKLYLAVDSSGFTSVPSRSELRHERYRGCILEATWHSQ